MAPETITGMLDELPDNSRILDPMCGSGVVLRHAGSRGHTVVGVDVDPLAVLMSRVWTTSVNAKAAIDAAETALVKAKRSRLSPGGLAHIKNCPETRDFVHYWFALPQQNQLARLAAAISWLDCPDDVRQLLQLALSRIIVTKHVGASLAWDVSHSRPHRVRDENDYDVYKGFMSAVRAIVSKLEFGIKGHVSVVQGDCRDLGAATPLSFDAVITSPPYLNAIDYLRGHKLALVWLGYSIPMLRKIRSGSIGTESSGSTRHSRVPDYPGLNALVPGASSLPIRQKSIVNKYAYDAESMIKSMRDAIIPSGKLVLVLADSVVRGVEVPSSQIFSKIAHSFGFETVGKVVREIPASKRYLPIAGETSHLSRRMRYESVETLKKC